jgi:hypothetical protein
MHEAPARRDVHSSRIETLGADEHSWICCPFVRTIGHACGLQTRLPVTGWLSGRAGSGGCSALVELESHSPDRLPGDNGGVPVNTLPSKLALG